MHGNSNFYVRQRFIKGYLILILVASLQCVTNSDKIVRKMKSYHNGKVIYDILQDIRINKKLQEIGLSEHMSSFQEDENSFVFQKSRRHGQLSLDTTRALTHDLAGSRDFSILLTIRQEKNNVGSLISFTNSHNRRLFELQSAWRREELRFHYVTENPMNMIHVEKLAYQLADDQWHQVALTISGDTVILHVDCKKVYERVLYKPIKEDLFFSNDISVWVGQRGLWSSYFAGEMQDALLVVGKHGFMEQCPQLDSGCPTCGQFKYMSASIESIQREINNLKSELDKAKKQISELKKCDCVMRCKHNNSYYEDGEKWAVGKCEDCSCHAGKVICGPRKCPVLACANPVHMEGDCCPKCLRSCDLFGMVGRDQVFEHGMNITSLSEIDDTQGRICVQCHCKDGSLECFEPRLHHELCPKPDCPKWQRKTNFVDCCPYCHGYDYCGKGHSCDVNAQCINLHNRYECRCKKGYTGNGFKCEDVDECAIRIHSCGNHSVCVNKIGSYACLCQYGFKKINDYHCIDEDECSSETSKCSQFAVCVNTVGSHMCLCKESYTGDGINCKPLCNPKCRNGGRCLKPNICSCPFGFQGARCEEDINECILRIHKCHENSFCVNLPGTYYCKCKQGFTDGNKDNLFGSLCKDINECSGTSGISHSCPPHTKCVNTLGAYRCVCTSKDHGICGNKHCIYRPSSHREIVVNDQMYIREILDRCSLCSCHSGYLNCSKIKCNCKGISLSDQKCCPGCLNHTAVSNLSCWDLTTNSHRRSGETWISECETCYCINGKIDCHPLLCPEVSCPHPVLREGHCCPMCMNQDRCTNQVSNKFRLGPPQDCIHESNTYKHGANWKFYSSQCVTCQCVDGHICCSHDVECRISEKIDNTEDIEDTTTLAMETTQEIDSSSRSSPKQDKIAGRPYSTSIPHTSMQNTVTSNGPMTTHETDDRLESSVTDKP